MLVGNEILTHLEDFLSLCRGTAALLNALLSLVCWGKESSGEKTQELAKSRSREGMDGGTILAPFSLPPNPRALL